MPHDKLPALLLGAALQLCSWHFNAHSVHAQPHSASVEDWAHTHRHAVKIYVYQMPPQFDVEAQDRGCFTALMTQRVNRSSYRTLNGSEADYYFIPGGSLYRTQAAILQMFEYIRQTFPWWNQTRDAGQARHIMVMASDDGAGEAFDRPLGMNTGVPPDVNPLSPNRTVLYMSWNGMQDGLKAGMVECSTCFQPGKDIMMPTAENICGPLCGYNRTVLKSRAVWGKNDSLIQAELHRPRKHLLFYGGMINHPKADDFTGRGGIYAHYVNHSDYLIVRRGEHAPVNFVDAMLDATFCLSPMGQNGGDTDRYIPSILFGCIPVMLNSSHPYVGVPHALPLEEVLPWHKFATVIDVNRLGELDKQLRCLKPHIGRMRAAMAKVWRSFLYTSIYKPYLGEDGATDAFHAIMAVLASRVSHGYRPSDKTMHRLKHGGEYFHCRPDSPPTAATTSP